MAGKGNNTLKTLAVTGLFLGNPQGAEAKDLAPKVVEVKGNTTEQVSRLSTNITTHQELIALNNEVKNGEEGDFRPKDVKEIDAKVASITEDFFINLEYNYGIKLNPKEESLVASRIENVLLGTEIGNLERGLRLVKIPEDQIKSIITEFQEKIPGFRKYLDQKEQEIMMAYRDITEEEAKIDKRIQEQEAEKERLQKEIANYEAIIATNEAKAAANEELHMKLQKTQELLQQFILQQEQLKKEKQDLQKQQGPMRA